MARLAFAIVMCLSLAHGTLRAQVVQSEQEQALAARARQFSQSYRAKDFAAAARLADETLALARQAGRTDVVAAMLYNKACLAALTGKPDEALAHARAAVSAGYADYYTYAADADFASLRDNSQFRFLLADLRAKAGIAPLQWQSSRTAPRPALLLDAPTAPQLLEMRRDFALDSVVADHTDDYSRLKALTTWASRQWEHSPTGMASKPDPLTILREAKAGGRFICRDYPIVVAGLARAYGMPARVLNLLPRDVETRSEAHSVAEVWIPRFRKWVLADGQYGIIAEARGVPLNGVELQAALARNDSAVSCAIGAEACGAWKPFILRNAYYFKYAVDQRRFQPKSGGQLVLVPKGAADPHKFAGGNEEIFAGAVYISNPVVFNAAPPR